MTPEEVLDASSPRGDAGAQPTSTTSNGRPRTARAPTIDFLCRCVEAAIKAGATTINLPDTVGYATPRGISRRCSATVRERVPNSDKAIFSVHCHDDLGLAVANSLAGVARRRAADRMHDQRPRRARRQRGAGRGRHGDAHARRRSALRHRHRDDDADPRLEARVGRDVVSGAVQQGDRRPQRLRA